MSHETVADYQARRDQEIKDRTAHLVAMTPTEHLEIAARIMATPVSTEVVTRHLMSALVHAQMATAKEAQR